LKTVENPIHYTRKVSQRNRENGVYHLNIPFAAGEFHPEDAQSEPQE